MVKGQSICKFTGTLLGKEIRCIQCLLRVPDLPDRTLFGGDAGEAAFRPTALASGAILKSKP
jgi:hypothetical protein